MLQLITKKTTISIIFAFTIAVLGGLTLTTKKAEAACAAQDTSRGTVTSSFSVTQAGTYTVWSRIMGNGTNDSYILEIDGTTCGITVGNANTSATGFNWINYRDGNASSKITVNLAAGAHTMTMIGKEDAVQLEQVLFLSDSSCTPTGVDGGTCVAPDTTPPSVSITSPTDGQIVTGSPVNIQAAASDDRGVVSKVEFYMGTALLGTDTSAPFAWPLVTTPYSPGTYQLTAKAFDDAPGGGNFRTSTAVSFTIPVPPDTTPPTVSLTAPVNGAPVSGNVLVSANASDNSGKVAKVEILVDNVVKTTLTTAPYNYTLDSTTLTDGSHTITAKAFDTSLSATASATVTVSNPAAPTIVRCDFDGNNKIGLPDLSTVLTFWNKSVTKNTSGDCTSDSKVSLLDLSELLRTYGT